MENDNGIAQKAPVFRDKDFMLLALSMARRSSAVTSTIWTSTTKMLVESSGSKTSGSERPYFFELRAHFMINGVWSGGWNIFICDTLLRKGQLSCDSH